MQGLTVFVVGADGGCLDFFSLAYHFSFLLSFSLSLSLGLVSWLVVLGLTALSVSISVYIGLSPREREKEKRSERKNVQTTPPAPTANTTGPCPTITQISRTLRHWKFTQHLRTTRPPHPSLLDEGGGRVVRRCWVNFQCRGVLQF